MRYQRICTPIISHTCSELIVNYRPIIYLYQTYSLPIPYRCHTCIIPTYLLQQRNMWSSKKIPTSLEKKNEQGTGVPQNINMIQDFQNHKTGKFVLSSVGVSASRPIWLGFPQPGDLIPWMSSQPAAGKWYGRGVPCSVYIIGDVLIIDNYV